MGKQWDKIFKQYGRVFTEPHEDIPKIVKLFKKKGVKRVLDLGCGSGRHLVYLARHGFEVYGIDISETGIKLSKEWLKEENLKANLKIGDIYKKLPYSNNFFDAIISVQVLHHNRIEKIRKAIKEIEREF
jgi:SAM-dependent methyltransferase